MDLPESNLRLWAQRRELDAIDMHWIAGRVPALPRRFGAKTRYRMPDAACEVSPSSAGCSARFDEPQWAPTPGQYLVLYDGDVCLGGGVIAEKGAGAGIRRLERAESA